MIVEKPRIWLASLIAPFALLIIPAILAGLTLLSDQPDDAPVKASSILLSVLPTSYPIIALIMAGVGYGLKAIDRLNLKSLIMLSFFLSIFSSLVFGLSSPFGIKDQIIGIVVFFAFTQSSFLCGVICWWYLLRTGQRK